MSIVGCYSMHLYCDRVDPNMDADKRPHQTDDFNALFLEHKYPMQSAVARGPHPGEFTGSTERDCIREAKRMGWYIRGKNVLCPACAKEFKK